MGGMMPIFEYGRGPIRDILRTGGDLIRGLELPQQDQLSDLSQFGLRNISGLLNQYTGHQDQQNLETTWHREDTAIQRQIADAEAAGINPMALFPGSPGAPTSSSGSTQPRASALAESMNLAQFDKRLELMDAQINNINTGSDLNLAKVDSERAGADKTNQEINFLSEYNPERLRQIAANIKNTEIRSQTEELRQELLKHNITQAEIDVLRAILGKRLDALKISQAEQNLILMGIAEETGRQEILQMKHNLGIAEDLEMPVGQWDKFKDIARILAGAIEGLGENIRDRLPNLEVITERISEGGQTGIDTLVGDLPDDAPRVQEVISKILGFVPGIAVIRAIREAIKKRQGNESVEEESGWRGTGASGEF